MSFDSFNSSFFFFSTGETIRIFRRSRTGRTHSTNRGDSGGGDENGPGPGGSSAPHSTEDDDDDATGLRQEDLPAPDTPAGTKEAFLK